MIGYSFLDVAGAYTKIPIGFDADDLLEDLKPVANSPAQQRQGAEQTSENLEIPEVPPSKDQFTTSLTPQRRDYDNPVEDHALGLYSPCVGDNTNDPTDSQDSHLGFYQTYLGDDLSLYDTKPCASNSVSSIFQTHESVTSDTSNTNKWAKFQRIREMTCETLEERDEQLNELEKIVSEFRDIVSRIGRSIIMEMNLPLSERKYPPTNGLHGVAGGEKYVYEGIMFKFARDTGLYGEDTYAIKAAGNELRNYRIIFSTNVSGLYVPLVATLDYWGFRISATSLIPIQPGSLVYGSADAGRTIHDSNQDLNQRIQELANRLNLKSHYAGRGSARRLVHTCADLEGHQGTDDRFYLLDTARLFAPTLPVSYEKDITEALVHGSFCDETYDTSTLKAKHSWLYYQIRPEFACNYPTPLSSDAFTLFDSDTPNGIGTQEAIQASHYYFKTHLPQASEALYQRYTTTQISNIGEQTIRNFLHSRGVNLRHLGIVRSYIQDHDHHLRSILLTEMIIRCLKQEIRREMREVITRYRQTQDAHAIGSSSVSASQSSMKAELAGVVVKYLRLLSPEGGTYRGKCTILYGTNKQEQDKRVKVLSKFWTITIKELLKAKFLFPLSKREDSKTHDLRTKVSSSTILIHFPIARRWLCKRIGVHMVADTDHTGSDSSTSSSDETDNKEEDIRSIAAYKLCISHISLDVVIETLQIVKTDRTRLLATLAHQQLKSILDDYFYSEVKFSQVSSLSLILLKPVEMLPYHLIQTPLPFPYRPSVRNTGSESINRLSSHLWTQWLSLNLSNWFNLFPSPSPQECTTQTKLLKLIELLEMAINIYQDVLEAKPNDFVSRVGFADVQGLLAALLLIGPDASIDAGSVPLSGDFSRSITLLESAVEQIETVQTIREDYILSYRVGAACYIRLGVVFMLQAVLQNAFTSSLSESTASTSTSNSTKDSKFVVTKQLNLGISTPEKMKMRRKKSNKTNRKIHHQPRVSQRRSRSPSSSSSTYFSCSSSSSSSSSIWSSKLPERFWVHAAAHSGQYLVAYLSKASDYLRSAIAQSCKGDPRIFACLGAILSIVTKAAVYKTICLKEELKNKDDGHHQHQYHLSFLEAVSFVSGAAMAKASVSLLEFYLVPSTLLGLYQMINNYFEAAEKCVTNDEKTVFNSEKDDQDDQYVDEGSEYQFFADYKTGQSFLLLLRTHNAINQVSTSKIFQNLDLDENKSLSQLLESLETSRRSVGTDALSFSSFLDIGMVSVLRTWCLRLRNDVQVLDFQEASETTITMIRNMILSVYSLVPSLWDSDSNDSDIACSALASIKFSSKLQLFARISDLLQTWSQASADTQTLIQAKLRTCSHEHNLCFTGQIITGLNTLSSELNRSLISEALRLFDHSFRVVIKIGNESKTAGDVQADRKMYIYKLYLEAADPKIRKELNDRIAQVEFRLHRSYHRPSSFKMNAPWTKRARAWGSFRATLVVTFKAGYFPRVLTFHRHLDLVKPNSYDFHVITLFPDSG